MILKPPLQGGQEWRTKMRKLIATATAAILLTMTGAAAAAEVESRC